MSMVYTGNRVTVGLLIAIACHIDHTKSNIESKLHLLSPTGT